jgi:hypothetical protein
LKKNLRLVSVFQSLNLLIFNLKFPSRGTDQLPEKLAASSSKEGGIFIYLTAGSRLMS